MIRIATLITCHNRKLKTLACLEALFNNVRQNDFSLDVILVDDGSTDGTMQAVQARFPQVIIIRGNGDLYWNGGMRVAFAAAIESDFDYYLWLNDDTILYPFALTTLLETENSVFQENTPPAVIVGSTQEVEGGQITYGGVLHVSRWRPIKFRLAIPGDIPISCDTMNGNCVLIPRSVVKIVGNLDSQFVHSIGDIDYGLRAKAAGFRLYVMPRYAGVCDKNVMLNSYLDSNLTRFKRFRLLTGKKGLPFRAWYVFTKRHCGVFWPLFWLWTYIRVFIAPVEMK